MRRDPNVLGWVAAALVVACGGSSVHHSAPEPSAAGDGSVSVGDTGGGGMGAGEVGVGGTGLGGTGVDGTGGVAPSAGSGEVGGTATNSAGMGGSGGLAPGEVPGCGSTPLDQCEEPSGALCVGDYCVIVDPLGWVDERGDGTLCKALPDARGPDFACLRGEWCEYDLSECRCGRHPGCQLGERCAPCAGPGCESPEYVCQRQIACTADNLDQCAAEPGQSCPDGSLGCAPAEICPTSDEDGSTRCDGAPGGCCPAGNWCFDGRECRCGAHASCTGDEQCVLSSVGLYSCCAPGRPCVR